MEGFLHFLVFFKERRPQLLGTMDQILCRSGPLSISHERLVPEEGGFVSYLVFLHHCLDNFEEFSLMLLCFFQGVFEVLDFIEENAIFKILFFFVISFLAYG